MTVVITGGASGIGAATANLFAARGARVSILDRDAALLEAVVDRLRAAGGLVDGHLVDVTDADAVQATVELVARTGDGLEAMHVNAGVEFAASVLDTSPAEWRRVIEVNLNGAFFAARAAVAEMQRGAGGAIVFTSSTLAERSAAETAAYSAAKAGMLGLMRVLSIEAAAANVRVNAILPGAIDTPMLRREAGLAPDPRAQMERFAAIHSIQRLGRPEEIAEAVFFLCSPAASFITGVALPVDGGVSAVQSAGQPLTYTYMERPQ